MSAVSTTSMSAMSMCCTETFTCISNNCPFVRKRVTDWCDTYGITYHLVEKDVCRTTIILQQALVILLFTIQCMARLEPGSDIYHFCQEPCVLQQKVVNQLKKHLIYNKINIINN